MNQLKNSIRQYSGTLSCVWALVIWVLCATPGEYIPSAFWMELLSIDKLVHVGMFFMLLSLAGLFAHKTRNETVLLITFFVLALAYGVLLEWMQAHVFSHRSADVLDILANSLGCLLALFWRKKVLRWIG